MTPKILAFAGSARRDSFNKRLVSAATSIAREAGADVTQIDLADYPFPLYNQDLEDQKGLPEEVSKLKMLMKDHDGFLISCPEYNSSITPLLKNTIDWASRAEEGEPPLACYRRKVATLLSASPGGLGGLRGLVTVRSILGNIGVLVLPTQVAVSQAHKTLSENGSITDEGVAKRVGKAVQELVDTLRNLADSR